MSETMFIHMNIYQKFMTFAVVNLTHRKLYVYYEDFGNVFNSAVRVYLQTICVDYN